MTGIFNDLAANRTGLGRRGLEGNCVYCNQQAGPMAIPVNNGLGHVGCVARARKVKLNAATEPRAPPTRIRELVILGLAAILILGLVVPAVSSAATTAPATLCASGDVPSAEANGTVEVVAPPPSEASSC